MTTAQFFVYKRPVAWTALVAPLLWGVYAYFQMPQRHDPRIPVRIGTVVTAYPGAEAEKVEQEVTRKIEKQLSENPSVENVRSLSRRGASVADREPTARRGRGSLPPGDDFARDSGSEAVSQPAPIRTNIIQEEEDQWPGRGYW